MIIVFAIWNCIYIPFKISFSPPLSPGIEIVNFCIDLMFYIDMGLCFRTTYLTFEGEEIVDWKKIGYRYIFKGTFLFDLLSVIPFNAMTPVTNITML